MLSFFQWHSNSYRGAETGKDNVFKFLRACEYGLPLLISAIELFARKLASEIRRRPRGARATRDALTSATSSKDGEAIAKIQATTIYCFNFDGWFSNLEVYGDCERVLSDSTKVKASLRINRINGEFDNTIFEGNFTKQLTGHCTPAKKLF